MDFGVGYFPTDNDMNPNVLARLVEESGQDAVQMMSVPCDPAVLERLAQAGVRRVCHWLLSAQRSTVERALDQWTDAISQFTGG